MLAVSVQMPEGSLAQFSNQNFRTRARPRSTPLERERSAASTDLRAVFKGVRLTDNFLLVRLRASLFVVAMECSLLDSCLVGQSCCLCQGQPVERVNLDGEAQIRAAFSHEEFQFHELVEVAFELLGVVPLEAFILKRLLYRAEGGSCVATRVGDSFCAFEQVVGRLETWASVTNRQKTRALPVIE